MPQITHEELQLMQRLKLKLLETLTNNPTDSTAKSEYKNWIQYVEEQIQSRGLACQDCRLDRH